jgi:Ni/Co efflux regulator RcnB
MMKRFLIAATALATLAGPMAASAQSYGEVRHDQREVRQEKQDVQRAQNRARADGVVTPGEQRAIQNQRRDVRDARQELHSDRQDYRQAQRWDRNNRNWWRGRNDFRGFNGRRAGYWYAPGYGYRRIDNRWVGYRWARGGVVPYGYRNYYVQDPYFYGLRPAPYGYRWIYVDNNLVLMAMATGLIADIVYNVY